MVGLGFAVGARTDAGGAEPSRLHFSASVQGVRSSPRYGQCLVRCENWVMAYDLELAAAIAGRRFWRRFSAFVLVVCSLLVTALAVGGRWSMIQYGNLAEWVAGIGTVAALTFAGRQVRASREQNELTRQELRLARRAIDHSSNEMEANRVVREESNRHQEALVRNANQIARDRARRDAAHLTVRDAAPGRFGLAVVCDSESEVIIDEVRVRIDIADHERLSGVCLTPTSVVSTSEKDEGLVISVGVYSPVSHPIHEWRLELRLSSHWFFCRGDVDSRRGRMVLEPLDGNPMPALSEPLSKDWQVWAGTV